MQHFLYKIVGVIDIIETVLGPKAFTIIVDADNRPYVCLKYEPEEVTI